MFSNTVSSAEHLELRGGGQVEHLVQGATEDVVQWRSICLTARLPRWDGNNNPGGRKSINCKTNSQVKKQPYENRRVSFLPTCRLWCGRKSHNHGAPWEPRPPELWCSPPDWMTARSYHRHRCRHKHNSVSVRSVQRCDICTTALSLQWSLKKVLLHMLVQMDLSPLNLYLLA